MYLRMLTDEYGWESKLYFKDDDGLVIDISEYSHPINEDENVIINGVEYYLNLVSWNITNKPYHHEYELVEYIPEEIIKHDITNYLKNK